MSIHSIFLKVPLHHSFKYLSDLKILLFSGMTIHFEGILFHVYQLRPTINGMNMIELKIFRFIISMKISLLNLLELQIILSQQMKPYVRSLSKCIRYALLLILKNHFLAKMLVKNILRISVEESPHNLF